MSRVRTSPLAVGPLARSSRSAGGAAFTLVELLVVVAILTLLLSILTPSLRRAGEFTRTAVCASHLHQLSGACGAYAADFRAWYPYRDAAHSGDPSGWYAAGPGLGGAVISDNRAVWTGYLAGYSPSAGHPTLLCPSVDYAGLAKANQGWPTRWWNAEWYNSSYAYYANYNTVSNRWYTVRFLQPFQKSTDPAATKVSLLADVIRRDGPGVNTANHGRGGAVLHMSTTDPAGANSVRADGATQYLAFSAYEDDTSANRMMQYLQAGPLYVNGFWAARY